MWRRFLDILAAGCGCAGDRAAAAAGPIAGGGDDAPAGGKAHPMSARPGPPPLAQSEDASSGAGCSGEVLLAGGRRGSAGAGADRSRPRPAAFPRAAAVPPAAADDDDHAALQGTRRPAPAPGAARAAPRAPTRKGGGIDSDIAGQMPRVPASRAVRPPPPARREARRPAAEHSSSEDEATMLL